MGLINAVLVRRFANAFEYVPTLKYAMGTVEEENRVLERHIVNLVRQFCYLLT